MAEIRCPNCGKDNPDFLDVCQFCQEPLEHEATVHIGEDPTKKDTGELEEILPDWLKEARKQGKDEEAADDAFRSQTNPKGPKEEPPDLLAGLMSQSDSDEDEVPDWLASINPVAEEKPVGSKSPAKEEPSNDFFAQFREAEQQSSAPAESEPEQEETPAWTSKDEEPSGQTDELTNWFSQGAAGSDEPVSSGASTGEASDDTSWMQDFASFDASSEEKKPAEKEPEDLSWLHDLEAASKGTDDLPVSQKGDELGFTSSSDEDMSWLDTLGSTSTSSSEEPAPSLPASSDEDMSWLNNLGGTPASESEEPAPSHPASSDDDSSWLDDFGGPPVSAELPTSPPSQPVSSDEDLDWLNKLGGTPASESEKPAPSQPASSDEDMSWLNNLGGPPVSESEEPAPSQPASSGEDLDWLKNLGGTPASETEEPATSQPASSDEDMSWLNNLGDTPVSESEKPVPSQPTSSDEDMDWLNKLGAASAPAFDEPVTSQPSSSDEGMSWLNALGGTAETEQPSAETETPQSAASQGDLDWLNDLSGTSEPSAPAFADTGQLDSGKVTSDTSKPFQTAPLNELLSDESARDTTPDWLKNAMEEPSMPAPGELSMDWLSEQGKPAEEENVPTQGEPASSQPAFELSSGDSSSASAQDVDSLFDMEMPDWLSREPESAETSQSGETPAAVDDTLSPVELPSWVQAMRPVASGIDNSAANAADQFVEREGPLAGFQGVIPSSPIGSSLRPKALSQKLQITEEQQASATLLERIIAGEAVSQPRKETAGISSQNVLRWLLSVLFLIVPGVALALNWNWMPITPSNQLSNIVATIPDSSPVFVVIDYDPSFVGEMEASAGPLLDQLALSKRSTFSFVSMSPNGSALVNRLMRNTGVTNMGYQAGTEYFNLGFLPGGSAGVLGFIEDPAFDFSQFGAVILMTDNAETGRVWVEQLEFAKGKYPSLAGKPLIVVSSAQSAPLLQPYVSSGQVDIMVNGLYDAAKYENMNGSRPGIARSYWDAFGIGLTMAVIAIILGSLWNVFLRIRERRAEAEQG